MARKDGRPRSLPIAKYDWIEDEDIERVRAHFESLEPVEVVGPEDSGVSQT